MAIQNNICYCGHEESCHTLMVSYPECNCCEECIITICDGCVDNTRGLDPTHEYKKDNLKYLELLDEENRNG